MAWSDRLREGLTKTRQAVQEALGRLIHRGPDPAVLEELEDALLSADLGVRTVQRLLDGLRSGRDAAALDPHGPRERPLAVRLLREGILAAFQGDPQLSIMELAARSPRPFVLLAVGVNGVGKTTTVAKLAQRFSQAGKAPLLVAADTFRAAAIEQLEQWGARLGVEAIRHRPGADPSAVVFDGLAAAKARKADVLLIDTAGRLHTKTNLMEELRKMKRVLAREMPGAPHEVLLVLDATVGQNALSQARRFHEAVGVTGIALTKLDGTARGGVVVAVSEELKIPVRLIGVGEAQDNLHDFKAREFVEALFEGL